jgi:hypothetical protein
LLVGFVEVGNFDHGADDLEQRLPLVLKARTMSKVITVLVPAQAMACAAGPARCRIEEA